LFAGGAFPALLLKYQVQRNRLLVHEGLYLRTGRTFMCICNAARGLRRAANFFAAALLVNLHPAERSNPGSLYC